MKKNIFCLIATIALLFSACSQEDFESNSFSKEKISATIVDENSQTRTTLNDKLQVVWSTGDAISIFAENGTSYTNNQGTIVGGVGSTDATFSVTMEGTTKVAAAYPYAGGTSYDGSKISISMPTEYTYSENGIGGAPMAALISNQNANIAFKNAGALMGLTVNNIPAGYNKAILTSLGDEALTGKCEIEFDGNGNPTLTTTASATGKGIIINFTASGSATNKTFYFPVPVGSYSSLQLSISDGDDTKVLKTKGLNAARSVRYKTTLTLDAVTGSTPVDASSAADATAKLEESNSVNVTIPESEENPTITLPQTSNNNPVSLSFENIPTGKTVLVTASTEQVSDNVNISASSDANSNNSFDIQLPNSTVTLNANGETATYDNVTAATAENTLIIGQGVTVNKLIVKKGHVRVRGTVNNISRIENSDPITYIVCEGELLNDPDLSDKIVYISAAEWDLIAAFKNGGNQTITLTEDVELTNPLTLNDPYANITVDLGTYSLTNKTASNYDGGDDTECYVFEVKAGTLNITGTTGSINAVGGSDYDMAVFANGTGNVNISGGKFTNLGQENDGCDLIYVRDNASVAISGGEFIAGNQSKDVSYQYVALNLRDADRSTASITVTGGKFHKFNPANNVSEGALTNFTANNTMVSVVGDVYEVIDLASGYTLTSNIEIATPIIINTTGEITLDLGTYSLTNQTAYDYDACGKNECYVFEVQAGTLNISGNGSVNAIGGSDYDMAVFAKGTGKVNISGGKFTNQGQENDGCDLIYVRDNAAVAISGGEFVAGNKSSDVSGQYVALNLRDADRSTASITVTGGKYYEFDPANNVSEGANTSFVAEGYSSAKEGEYYVVTKSI